MKPLKNIIQDNANTPVLNEQSSPTSKTPRAYNNRIITALNEVKNFFVFNGKRMFDKYIFSRQVTQYNLMSDIQDLKNDDLINEEHSSLLLDAKIAAFPYNQNIDEVNSSNTNKQNNNFNTVNWNINSKCIMSIYDNLTSMTEFKNAVINIENGKIIDKSTGLTAYILENNNKEIRIVFGGTTSGDTAGGLIKRSIANFRSIAHQWKANIDNVFSKNTVPTSYIQAQIIVEQINNIITDDSNLTISGHSKGAAEAVFASLMLKNPCKTICFSSAELGNAAYNKIPQENIKNAYQYIKHYFIEKDIVSNISNTFVNRLNKLGVFYRLKGKNWSSFIDRHDKFVKHIDNFVNKK